jgi:hypothetical protein
LIAVMLRTLFDDALQHWSTAESSSTGRSLNDGFAQFLRLFCNELPQATGDRPRADEIHTAAFEIFDRTNAMTAAWPILFGAVDFERGLAGLKGRLVRLEKPERNLLLDPPFADNADPGRITHYPPGVRARNISLDKKSALDRR